MTALAELSNRDITSMPLDRLALILLEHCAETDEWNSHNVLNSAQQHQGRDAVALRCLSEALNWLITSGLIARDKPGQNSAQSIFITRLGDRVLHEGIGVAMAGSRLAIDVHARLGRARSQFLQGDYELAAFAAMREVEIRIRQLSGADESLLGVKLAREAFKRDGGPLADGALDPGEQVGVMELYSGAIGTFKNPPSHRQVDYDDPTVASEIVLLADLLMRLLDRTAERLGVD